MRLIGRIGLVIGVACVLLLQAALWYSRLPYELRGDWSDFGTYYTAGHLIAEGQADKLYKEDFSGIAHLNPRTLPFIHPAYEAAIFAPLARFSFRTAYFIFMGINLTLGLISLRLLTKDQSLWVLFLAGFAPLSYTLIEGQDSIMMLFIMTITYWLLRRGQDLPAGAVMGMALFRFQIIIPIGICFLLWKRKQVVAGLTASGIALAAISVIMTGTEATRDYLHRLAGFSSQSHPVFMVSFRGIVTQLLGNHAWLLFLVLLVSIATIWWRARNAPQDRAEALQWAIPVGLLTGFHVYLHDAAIASIAMIPQLKTGNSWRAWFVFLTAAVGVFNNPPIWICAVALIVLMLGQRNQSANALSGTRASGAADEESRPRSFTFPILRSSSAQ
jgi:hypothetical protein